MPQFDQFADFYLGGGPTDAEVIYNQIKGDLGATYDWTVGTYAEARVFALAKSLAYARAFIRRVPAEFHPMTSYDLLSTLEKDWSCTPGPVDAVLTRQLRVAARKLLMAGSREEALVTDLTAAVGAGFLKVNAIAGASVVNYPVAPDSVGTFPNPSTPPKFFRTVDEVAVTGVTVTIRLTAINGSAAPLAREKLTIEPETNTVAEQINASVVTNIGGVITITTSCLSAHSPGAWVLTAAPLWLSNQRELGIVVTSATAADPEKRRKINEVMQRHGRSVTRWNIVRASNATQVGPFVFGTGIIGSTALGAAAVTF